MAKKDNVKKVGRPKKIEVKKVVNEVPTVEELSENIDVANDSIMEEAEKAAETIFEEPSVEVEAETPQEEQEVIEESVETTEDEVNEEPIKDIIEEAVEENPIEEVKETVVEVMNGDPAVVAPTEEEKKADNKTINNINKMFGYVWNGQEIDY